SGDDLPEHASYSFIRKRSGVIRGEALVDLALPVGHMKIPALGLLQPAHLHDESGSFIQKPQDTVINRVDGAAQFRERKLFFRHACLTGIDLGLKGKAVNL